MAQYWCLVMNAIDGVLRTLCHTGGFACQQRLLETFPDPGYLHSEDVIV